MFTVYVLKGNTRIKYDKIGKKTKNKIEIKNMILGLSQFLP